MPNPDSNANHTHPVHTTATIYDDASGYWKLCTLVLGLGFMIAVASHATPSSAHAATTPTNSPNLLTVYQSQSPAPALSSDQATQPSQLLSIGGFDTINGQPAFVILNDQGQRIGTLPMNAMND